MTTIKTDFEGANPGGGGQVERLGEAAFRLRPYSEDGDGNYKFALLVRAANGSAEAVEAEVVVDWEDAVYMSCRDYVLLGRGDRWRAFPARVEGSVATARVTVPPGRWELALHPTFGLERVEAWRRRAERDERLVARELGRSGQGRAVVAMELGDPSAGQAGRVAVLGRMHPYETAGSFAAEGALRQLLRLAGAGGLSGRRASVVLIANPDGVAGGLCKRTRPGGPDMAHEARSSADPAVAAVRRWLEEFAPGVLMDFHGWMHRYEDGLGYTEAALAGRLERELHASGRLDRAWKRGDLSGRGQSESMWSHALTACGAQSLIFSFGWYGRTVGHMRGIGADVASAVLRCTG